MCTVTCIFQNNELFITSNRDESSDRSAASLIEEEKLQSRIIYYARDTHALGTWFVFDNQKNVAVLLNGAFEKHEKKLNYRKSRGLILLEIFKSDRFPESFSDCNLDNIEPFQLITYNGVNLQRWVWDGFKKHFFELDLNTPYIFSSSTLYNPEQIAQRRAWFDDFLKHTTSIEKETIFDFHTSFKSEDSEIGLVINRNEKTKTVSVSQVKMAKNDCEYQYLDIIHHKRISKNIVVESNSSL